MQWSAFPCNVNEVVTLVKGERPIRFYHKTEYRESKSHVRVIFRLKLEKSRHILRSAVLLVMLQISPASTSYSLIGQDNCKETIGRRFLRGKRALGAFWRETGDRRFFVVARCPQLVYIVCSSLLFWRESSE